VAQLKAQYEEAMKNPEAAQKIQEMQVCKFILSDMDAFQGVKCNNQTQRTRLNGDRKEQKRRRGKEVTKT
jgi:hypothetical protein